MELLSYLIVILISYLGLPIGFFIAKLTKPELKPGKIYFKITRIAAFLAIIFFLFYFDLSIITIPLAVILLTGFIVFEISPGSRKKELAPYIALAVVTYIQSEFSKALAITASLIFIYGIPAASLYYLKYKDLKLLYYTTPYLVISALLHL